MAKYSNKPTLESVAARRNQSLAQLVAEWGVTSVEDLMKRCKREGVAMPADFTFAVSVKEATKDVVHADIHITVPEAKPSVKNALVDLSKESEEVAGKKAKKGKLTPDEPAASDEHVGVDTRAPAGPKDPA